MIGHPRFWRGFVTGFGFGVLVAQVVLLWRGAA